MSCENCEESSYVIDAMAKLLAEIAIVVNGPEPPLTSWSYHDLPEKVRALKQAPPAALAETQECGGQDANPASLVTPHSSHGMGTQPVVVPFAPRNGAPNTTPPPEPAEQLAWIQWKHQNDGGGWTVEDSFNFRCAFVAGYRAARQPAAAVPEVLIEWAMTDDGTPDDSFDRGYKAARRRVRMMLPAMLAAARKGEP